MTRYSKYPNRNLRGVQPAGPQNVSQNIGSNRVFWCDRDPTTNDFDNWFIGSRWISYAAGATASPKIWTLVRKTIGAGHIKTSTWIESGEVDQSQIIYVGKHGNDANDGKTIDKAKLTFVAAIAAAAYGDTVWCFDDGEYIENLVFKDSIKIFAPNATLTGAHAIGNNNIWRIGMLNVATGTTGITFNRAIGAYASVIVNNIVCSGTGIAFENLRGSLGINILVLASIENGYLIGPTSINWVSIQFIKILCLGTGAIFAGSSTAYIRAIGSSINNTGGGNLTCFYSTGAETPTMSLTVTALNTDILSNITAGSVVTTNITHKIGTLAEVGAGTVDPGKLEWNVITADLNPVVKNHGYICNKVGLLTLTLPTTAAVGEIFRVTGINTALGWTVAQNAGQQIHIDNLSTTAGVGGSISSSAVRDSVELVCVVADTEWNATSFVGTITVI